MPGHEHTSGSPANGPQARREATAPEQGDTARGWPRRDVSAAGRARGGDEAAGHGPGRRAFLRVSGGMAAAGGLAGAGLLSTGPAAQAAQAATLAGRAGRSGTPQPEAVAAHGNLTARPIRPPAAPLAVRGPYLSTWLPATTLPGTWQQFWQGHTTAMGGIVRIDGTSYQFMGDPTIILNVPNGNNGTPSTVQDFQLALEQTLLEVTPTRSTFTLEGGGIELTVEFLSPVEPGDIRRQSIPLSYLQVSARAIDGRPHDVQIYADISGEWCSGDDTQVITWAPSQVTSGGQSLQAWTVQLQTQQPLTEQDQQAAWGNVVWAAPSAGQFSYQSGQDVVVRGQFVGNGKLADTNDTNYRAINDNWPVFGFCLDVGRVSGQPVSLPLAIGQVRTPAVSYLGQDLQPLWTSYFASWQDMLGFFFADLPAAQRRATTLDRRITQAAEAAGGTSYAGLCAIALRQAYGGTELVVGPSGQPWAFLKEISSDGNVSTVDVLFPGSPAWIYLDPGYLALLLDPLLAYAESGDWPQTFAEHDLGSAYPVAAGHNDGGGENMPMEESGNMLIMTAAYLRQVPAATAKAFAGAHYPILKQWADYLVANLPDPGFQNQTDDFAGPIAHSVNLALKGIIGVAAMSQIATLVGNSTDAAAFAADAKQFIGYWQTNAQDPSAPHLDLTYNGADGGNGTWGTVYNGFADRLLGTGLVPSSVLAEQAAWYESVSNLFGLPLQVPHSYAKSDWEMLTAALLSDYPIKQQLIEQVYTYANTTPSLVPFSDLYDTVTGGQVAFQARPVQGGMFALLALVKQARLKHT
jgi:Domain of unknown function (DUF5127)/Domain of unknown function (DUF4965)/Domain of unknown function (DUF1793)/Domain of unknown function (DUF4964)